MHTHLLFKKKWLNSARQLWRGHIKEKLQGILETQLDLTEAVKRSKGFLSDTRSIPSCMLDGECNLWH
jgi:hypothetical protein